MSDLQSKKIKKLIIAIVLTHITIRRELFVVNLPYL